jgi:hypothetical protein
VSLLWFFPLCVLLLSEFLLHVCSLANALSSHEKLDAEIKRLGRLVQSEENKAASLEKVIILPHMFISKLYLHNDHAFK